MIAILILLPLVLTGCWSSKTEQEKETRELMKMTLSSPAFSQEGTIPSEYTCEGANYSPELSWSNIPTNAKSLALICDDPDASPDDPADPAAVKKTWTHWVIFNLSPTLMGLAQGVTLAQLPGAVEGTNSFGKTTYGGPCPPKGSHRYFFKLYALDTVLSLDRNATAEDVRVAMEGHILAQAELMGRYQKQK